MKIKIWVMLKLMLISVRIIGQTGCDQNDINQMEHSWNKEVDANTRIPGNVNLPKEQAVIKSISEIASALYPKPKGGEVYWHGNFDISHIENQYPNSYSIDVVLKPYRCKNDQVILTSYTSSLFISINSPGFMGGTIEISGKKYSTIRALSETKNGYTYFNFDENDRVKVQEMWIISYKDKLPYTYMTRKEYLIEARADQVKEMEGKIDYAKKGNKVRPQSEQDAAKQKSIESFKKNYQGAALESRIAQFNKDYKSDQQILDEALADIRKWYDKIFKVYDDFLASHSEEYLSKPAIVLPYTRANFDGFETNMKDKNLVYIIKNDPSYYNRDLPVTSPQYITVLMRYMTQGVPDKFFYEGLNKKSLLDSLSGLLGKQ
jgi:hypothetical protein